jgi:Esterase/lipase
VVFNIDYRVAADHAAYPGSGVEGTTVLGQRWPAQRQDIARANDWLRLNAAQFGMSPTRVASYGFSAGGHLSHKAANYYGTSKFRASVSVSAVLQPTRTAEISMNGSYGGDTVNSTLVKSFGYMTSLIGCSYEPTWADCGGKWKSIKLETDFGSTKPPMYIVKGDSDAVEPYTALGSIGYWANYYGQDSTEVGVAGGGHDESMISGTTSADIARWNALVTWLKAKTA